MAASTPTTNEPALPKLVVFDLDYTLWPFWIDTHAAPPPYKALGLGTHAIDRAGFEMRLYKDVQDIFSWLQSRNVSIGIASRTEEPDWARNLMSLLTIDHSRKRVLRDYVEHEQIFPGCKIAHFREIAKSSGHSFEDMIFFDDEHRNIRDVSGLGVTCVLVEDGMSMGVLQEGLEQWRQNNSKGAS